MACVQFLKRLMFLEVQWYTICDSLQIVRRTGNTNIILYRLLITEKGKEWLFWWSNLYHTKITSGEMTLMADYCNNRLHKMHYAVKLTGEKIPFVDESTTKKVLSRCFFTCFVGFLDEFAHLHSWRQVMKSTRIKNVLSNETCIKWRMLVKLAALQFIRFHS